MPSKRRPKARRGKQPRATSRKSTFINIPQGRRTISESDRAFEAKKRAFAAIARMRRDGLSLSAACREEGTTPETVWKYLPAAIRRSKSGRWIATKSDPYIRSLSLPGLHGPVRVLAHGSEEARFASAYLSSIARWMQTGKAYELAPFHGKKIGELKLITAPRTLHALGDAGLLQLDSLYAALRELIVDEIRRFHQLAPFVSPKSGSMSEMGI